MISKATLLFLFGTTLTSAQFWPSMQLAPYGIALAPTSKSSGCPSGPELAPLICKFMQQNFEFKPQLIAPSTYIAPLVVEKCDTSKLEMEIELPSSYEEKKPLVIPQPPELPPMTIPKFPVPVIIEEPPANLQEEIDLADIEVRPVVIPEAPEQPSQEEQEIHQNAAQLASLPAAPELRAFVMPELPVRIIDQEPSMPAVPCLEDIPAPAQIPTYVEPLAFLPAAPELPAFVMPELAVRVVDHESPMSSAPLSEDEAVPAPIPVYFEPLAPLPAAPELPDFVMPEIPISVASPELPVPAFPNLEDEPAPEPIPAYIEPLATLPDAPKLPEFVMPEIPAQVVEDKLPVLDAPYINDESIPTYVAPLPAAPELPPFEIPEFAVRVAEYSMPEGPFGPIPTYHQPLSEFNFNMVDYQPMPVPLPVQPLAPMPAAPELPTITLPETPVRVEIPSAPVIIEQPHDEPAFFAEVDYNNIEYQPMVVPQPPELPAFVMPELPVRIAEPELPMPVAPYLEPPTPIAAVPEYFEPLAPVPAAPELLPASVPEIPVRLDTPVEPEVKAALKAIKIPQAPILPELEMPELPVKIEIEERAPCTSTLVMPNPIYQNMFPSHITLMSEKAKEMQNTLLPYQPLEPNAFPMPCVYNLVMQHVLPNMMMPHKFRPVENIAIQPAPFVPCS